MAQEPYLGSVHIFAFNFAPVNYLTCSGQILAIAQNTALFSLLGTTYGGDGQTTFQLPNLQGRVPLHMGQRQGGPTYVIGQVAGNEQVTLLTSQLPSHTHTFTGTASTMSAIDVKATSQTPTAGALLARGFDGSSVGAQPRLYVPAGTTGDSFALGGLNVAGTNAPTGGNVPVSVLQPYLALNFCIAQFGIFPSRN